jgi:hypothetical protein
VSSEREQRCCCPYICRSVKATMRSTNLLGLLVNDSFFRKDVSQNL